jgi:hypothetical protein
MAIGNASMAKAINNGGENGGSHRGAKVMKMANVAASKRQLSANGGVSRVA